MNFYRMCRIKSFRLQVVGWLALVGLFLVPLINAQNVRNFLNYFCFLEMVTKVVHRWQTHSSVMFEQQITCITCMLHANKFFFGFSDSQKPSFTVTAPNILCSNEVQSTHQAYFTIRYVLLLHISGHYRLISTFFFNSPDFNQLTAND